MQRNTISALVLPFAVVALLQQTPRGQAERLPRPAQVNQTLSEARRGFKTKLLVELRQATPIPAPPAELFTVVEFDAPLGKLSAYLSPVAAGESGRPAIVWLTGGTPAARGGAYVWTAAPPENDQSAGAYRDAGVVMMFPTVRGTCQNPGFQELMFGEVDDVIAAGRFLRAQPQVDPTRVYLGGHSTGGTLALLVAESTDIFRAVFSFGPVGELADYGERDWPFDERDAEEQRLRSPLQFLGSITTPTYVFEGEHGNAEDLLKLSTGCENPSVRFLELASADHFSLLTPVNRLLAAELMTHRDGSFDVDLADFAEAYADFWQAQREARDLHLIAELRSRGATWGTEYPFRFSVRGRTRDRVTEVGQALAALGFEASETRPVVDEAGASFHRVTLMRVLPFQTASIFAASRAVREAVDTVRLVDEGWTVEALPD